MKRKFVHCTCLATTGGSSLVFSMIFAKQNFRPNQELHTAINRLDDLLKNLERFEKIKDGAGPSRGGADIRKTDILHDRSENLFQSKDYEELL